MKKNVNEVITIDNPIVVLDMGISSLSLLNDINKLYSSENICYVNDLATGEYEGREANDIKNKVKKLIGYVETLKPKLLVVANDSIIEYASDLFEGLNYPVIKVLDVITSYVNENYEYKNMAFLAPQGVIEANLYQKNFRYNHLYNLPCDELLAIVNNQNMKTSESFSKAKATFAPALKKDVEVVIVTQTNLELLYTEMNEYFKDVEIMKTSGIIAKSLSKVLKEDKNKAKGKIYLHFNKEDIYQENGAFRKILKQEYKIINWKLNN